MEYSVMFGELPLLPLTSVGYTLLVCFSRRSSLTAEWTSPVCLRCRPYCEARDGEDMKHGIYLFQPNTVPPGNKIRGTCARLPRVIANLDQSGLWNCFRSEP